MPADHPGWGGARPGAGRKPRPVDERQRELREILLAQTTDEDIIAALGSSPRTVARVRKRLVTEGLEAAIDHKPQPARPDKIKMRTDNASRGPEGLLPDSASPR